MESINQPSDDHATSNSRDVENQNAEGRSKFASTENVAGEDGQVDTRDVEANCLDDVRDLVKGKFARDGKAKIEGAHGANGHRRNAWLDVPCEGGAYAKEGNRPDENSCLVAIGFEQALKNEWKDDARQTGARPHDSIGKTLALDEPLVDIHGAWRVGNSPTNAVEDTLGDDELGDIGRPSARAKRGAENE